MTQEAWQIKGQTVQLLEVDIGEYVHDLSLERVSFFLRCFLFKMLPALTEKWAKV